MKPDIDYEMIKQQKIAQAITTSVALLQQTGMYNDGGHMAIGTKLLMRDDNRLQLPIAINFCAIVIMGLQANGVLGCNPTVSYGHQLLDEMLAVQHKYQQGLGKLREGIEATFTAAAREDKGDDWQEAVVHSLECLLAAGLIESARQLELRRN